MYWQEKMLQTPEYNMSYQVAQKYEIPLEHVEQALAAARVQRDRALRDNIVAAFRAVGASLLRAAKVINSRNRSRRAYADLIHADSRLLADIGLDRNHLQNAVFGSFGGSLLVDVVKALFVKPAADEITAEVSVIMPVVDLPELNDDHRQAA